MGRHRALSERARHLPRLLAVPCILAGAAGVSLAAATPASARTQGAIHSIPVGFELPPAAHTYRLSQVRSEAPKGVRPPGSDLPRWTDTPSSIDSTRVASTNWAGYIAAGSGYTAVEGQWTVPTVTPAKSPHVVATWVGIGGGTQTTSSLIQTGTTVTTVNRSTTYSAWIELIPAPSVFVHTVHPGDHMIGVVEERSADRWRVGIEDVTAGWTVETTTVSYALTSGLTAEWITERPTTGTTGALLTLADFGSTRFHDLSVNKSATQTTLDSADMYATTGTLLAYPGPLGASTTGSFTDYYAGTSSPTSTSSTSSPSVPTPAAPAPTVTSVAPRTGPTSGGTTVTVSGTHFTGSTAVTFGSTAAAGFRVTSSTRITATAPAGTGTVDITVTTPGGTSAVVGTGQFTYRIQPTSTRIYGQTADATAAAELEHQFPATTGSCPASRAVVLATDEHYPDALSSAYLARDLGTGTLLTPTGSLSAPARGAIVDEGIDHVYVVGGPYAVSTTVASTIEAMQATECGGGPGTGQAVQVTRVWGRTEYGTAAQVATSVPSTRVGTLDLSGAYAGGGAFDRTGGAESAAAPPGTPRTAIVATGQSFQDAEAASALAYADSLPILLTTSAALSPQAQHALGTLAIRQVIVMGGQLAVSDTVVAQLVGMGVSVLRVSGTTYSGTAAELATLEMQPAPDGAGWTTSSVAVARGDSYSDGIAGAVVAADGPAATHPEPLLLTVDPGTVGTTLTSFLESDAAPEGVRHLTILGGPLAVSPAVVTAMLADLAAGA